MGEVVIPIRQLADEGSEVIGYRFLDFASRNLSWSASRRTNGLGMTIHWTLAFGGMTRRAVRVMTQRAMHLRHSVI